MRLLSALLSLILLLAGLGAVVVAAAYSHYSQDLPDYGYLTDYQPPTLSRIYADDGRMMAAGRGRATAICPHKFYSKTCSHGFSLG